MEGRSRSDERGAECPAGGRVYNPMDDSEVAAATAPMLKQWYDQYRLIKKGAPLVGKDPTPDQILALHT